jgi:hypothetical protein
MPVTVKAIKLWRKEVENKPGVLAGILGPLADAGVDLKTVMGYRYPGDHGKAAIELFPVSGRKAMKAAAAAGMEQSEIPVLLVEGDNKPGIGAAVGNALAEAGINTDFLLALVIGRKYSMVCGFETADDAKRASAVIKKATAPKKR